MKHLIKFIIGNLKKSKVTTVFNIIGLTSAFAAFFLIIVYVWNEYHFDCFNLHVNEIYRIELKNPDNPKTSVFLSGPTGKTITQELPEVLASTIYMPWGKWDKVPFQWNTPSAVVKEFEDYAYSDEKLTDIFTFTFIQGKKDRPLLEPQSAIVSESFARKAWHGDNPVGKQLKMQGDSYTITAVFSDLPENSVIQCPIILKLPTKGRLAENAQKWGIVNYPQFILVKPGTDCRWLAKKINNLSVLKSKYNGFVNGNSTVQLIARPLRDLHFTNEVAENPLFTSNSRMFVNSLFFVGILVILIALINFINFATANVPQRIKSISITRIMGSSRFHIVSVYILEALLLFVFSFAVALLMSFVLNQSFSSKVFGYELPFSGNWWLFVVVGVVIITLGLAAATYPAFYSTSEKSVNSIKRFNRSSRGNFRGVLTVSQFIATIVLIIASFTVIKQVQFMEETNLGYNKGNTLVIKLNDELKKNKAAFENKLKQCPYVKEYAYSRAVPGVAQEMNVLVVNGEKCQVWYWAVDTRYIDMMGFQFTQGRSFIKDSKAENKNLICNETAVKRFGWKIGEKIGDGTLVGILKDFNYVSLRQGIEPFVFYYSDSPNRFGCISLKLSQGSISQALPVIRKAYDEASPEIPFGYYFLDDHLNALYYNENSQVKLIIGFSILSVLVSILGIFGLSIFMCQQKVKEIGVRKVIGAQTSEVMAMLNTGFVKWVAIAFVIATPLAYYAMNKWLGNFAYKTSLSWWIFALAGALALLVAILTVSWQSWLAATKNPVEALKYE